MFDGSSVGMFGGFRPGLLGVGHGIAGRGLFGASMSPAYIPPVGASVKFPYSMPSRKD